MVPESEARRRQLAQIHIAKKQLGLDDVVYREMLESVAGVNSSSELSTQGRIAVLDHMKECGFRPVHRSAKRSGLHNKPPKNKRMILSKIGAILADMELPWEYSDGIAKQMYGVDRLLWLHPEKMHKVLISLIYNQKNQSNTGKKAQRKESV